MSDLTDRQSATSALAYPVGDDISAKTGSARLSGRMGPIRLLLMVLAFSAPIVCVEGLIPLTIQFGGPGASFAFVLTTAILLLFSVGYVTMARHVPKPGDFYAFISSGLGKVFGLGAAFLAVFSYLALLGGTYIFLGISTTSLITSLGGPQTAWWIWALIGWIGVSILGYFHIELSAKVLSVSMVVEIAIVMIFNIAVLVSGGENGLSITPFTPSSFAQGDMGVTMLYAVLVFLGFEATALFRDEVYEPTKTIPRATYGAVAFVGFLYTLSCYGLVTAFGAHAWDVAKNDPTTMFAVGIGKFVAPVFDQITYASVILSALAACISIHNVLSRYVLNLAADKALPKYLSKVHERHSSPHMASNAVAALCGLFLLPFMLMKVNTESVYGLATGIGAIGVVALMAVVSYAVIAWFARSGIPAEENAFKVFGAPGIAATALTLTVIFAVVHLDLVVGGTPGQYVWVVYFLIGIFVAGSLIALYFRAAKPDVYENLGRAERIFEFLAHRREQAGSD